jgi:outer membrane lipoprotein-sorting protein
MIWIDRRSFLVQKVVFYANGERERTIRVDEVTLNQGLTADEVLALPENPEIVRG